MDDTKTVQNNNEAKEEQITKLAEALYYASGRIREEYSLKEFTEKILDAFLDKGLTIEEVKEKLVQKIAEREKAQRDDLDISNVSKNHERLYKLLKELFVLLNQEEIDYQLSGDLSVFAQYDTESNFAHYNIDISVNEKDIPKVAGICEKLGLAFADNRMTSKRVLRDEEPTAGRDVLAKDSEGDIILGFNLFERKIDGTVVEKDYYRDNDNNPMVQETIYPPELAKLVYGKTSTTFKGVPINVQPSEYTYLQMTESHNWKNTRTMSFEAEKIDLEKIGGIKSLMNQKTVNNRPANTNLDQMIAENGIDANQREEPKQFVKASPNSEEGFISNTIITTLALITFVLCFIGIAIIYLVK